MRVIREERVIAHLSWTPTGSSIHHGWQVKPQVLFPGSTSGGTGSSFGT